MEVYFTKVVGTVAGVDPGFFFEGGTPLRNDLTDGCFFFAEYYLCKKDKGHLGRGGGEGAHPWHPSPRSSPE